VIHHACCSGPLAEPVSTVPVTVVEAPFGRALMTTTRPRHRRATRLLTTPRVAVPGQPASASRAQEEGLTTPSTDQPPTRVQGSPPWLTRRNWTARSARAKTRSGAVLRRLRGVSELLLRASSPHPGRRSLPRDHPPVRFLADWFQNPRFSVSAHTRWQRASACRSVLCRRR